MAHLVKTLALDPKRPLLLTFDAFGTLYTPRAPVGTIYAECARKYGLTGFTDGHIEHNLRQAFKRQRTLAPNYGAGTSTSSPYGWWRQIAKSTFADLTADNDKLTAIFDDLWHQFGSSQAYQLQPNALNLFATLRDLRKDRADNREPGEITVGVISNSDPRVSQVLTSFGIRVREHESTRRQYEGQVKASNKDTDSPANSQISNDIDFIATSYEVGYEKPASGIFEAAYKMAISSSTDMKTDCTDMQCLHVGDDLLEDYDGAHDAGWMSILVGSQYANNPETGHVSVSGPEEIKACLEQLYQVPE